MQEDEIISKNYIETPEFVVKSNFIQQVKTNKIGNVLLKVDPIGVTLHIPKSDLPDLALFEAGKCKTFTIVAKKRLYVQELSLKLPSQLVKAPLMVEEQIVLSSKLSAYLIYDDITAEIIAIVVVDDFGVLLIYASPSH